MNRGFQQDELDQFQKDHQEVHAKIQANTPQKICETISTLIMQRESKRQWDHHALIFDYIMTHCQTQGTWFPNKFQLDRWIKTIQSMNVTPYAGFDKLKERWYHEMYPSTQYCEMPWHSHNDPVGRYNETIIVPRPRF